MKKVIFFLGGILYANMQFYTYSLKLNYKEYINGKVIDKDYNKNGDILGIGIKFVKNSFFNYYLKSEYARGDSYYEGINWEGDRLKVKQDNFYLWEVEGGIGKYVYLIGGYRFWNRGKSNIKGDYNEKYYWKYIGVKFCYKFEFNNFYFYPEFGYKKALNPKVKVEIANEPILDLGNTTGKFVEIPFYYKLSKKWNLKIFYKYDYWHVNASNIGFLKVEDNIYPIFEPESKTKNQYFGIGISYEF